MNFRTFTSPQNAVRVASVLFLLMVNNLLASSIDSEEIFKKYAPSVMLIHSNLTDGGKALGTGFVLKEDGIIVTNFHVIEGSKDLSAEAYTGGKFPITSVLATDKKRDIAVLKIDARNLVPLKLADSDKVISGMSVVVIGNPIGLEQTITEGIVSAIRTDKDHGNVIQISAAISHGSSGSPVFNKEGEVIGMATFTFEGGESLNFAIASKGISDVFSEALKAASNTVPQGDNGIYTPNQLIKGSKDEDIAAANDPRFKKYKDLEQSKSYFEMLPIANSLAKDYQHSALVQRLLSDSYYYTGDSDAALTAAKSAIDLDPTNARSWDNLGVLLPKNQKSIVLKAIRINPNDVKILSEFVEYNIKESPDAALSALNHAKSLLMNDMGMDLETIYYKSGSDTGLKEVIIEQYGKLDHPKEGYQAAWSFLEKTPDDPDLLLAFAKICIDSKIYDKVT